MTNVFYVNTFNDPNKLSDKRFLVVWEVELTEPHSVYSIGNDSYKFAKKIYDANNKFKGGEVLDPAPVLIVHSKKYLITQIFERWRGRYET